MICQSIKGNFSCTSNSSTFMFMLEFLLLYCLKVVILVKFIWHFIMQHSAVDGVDHFDIPFLVFQKILLVKLGSKFGLIEKYFYISFS